MTPPDSAHSSPRRATRSTGDRVLGGVAAGLADHLGVDVLAVRTAFVLASALGGLGVAIYAGLWMSLPPDTRFADEPPGLAAATRQGKRPHSTRSSTDSGLLVALGVLGLGLVVLVQIVLGHGVVFWPIFLAAIGIAMLWRQADEAQRERWLDSSGRVDLIRIVIGQGGIASYARLAAGVGLLLAALGLFAAQTGQAAVARDVIVAGILGVAGLALMVGPWLFRLAGDLSAERAARVRSQERADVAAHLHDSVLQTLALIQKHADDGRTVATLARAQERDLRSWLYGAGTPANTSVAGALRSTAAEVEDAYALPVEVVTTGDCVLSEQLQPVVLAAREAMANAAAHSGSDKVDVFAEMSSERVEVFVRDRGRGFDAAAVPDDRLGVRRSIHDRMRRHGGSSTIRTGLGEGTEVKLSMDIDTRKADQ